MHPHLSLSPPLQDSIKRAVRRTQKISHHSTYATVAQLDEADAAAENTANDLFIKFKSYQLALREVVERKKLDLESKIQSADLHIVLTKVFGSEMKATEVRHTIIFSHCGHATRQTYFTVNFFVFR